ncbi:Brefeldin A-inhibited guanine nucleotide-exchange protein 2 [Nowakowskiella sp. JEL0407]|nr:Brefeldin A-inhibited guanine nucleotide-exchange protein 2 [Nowakowskiella sp. JEL0407]
MSSDVDSFSSVSTSRDFLLLKTCLEKLLAEASNSNSTNVKELRESCKIALESLATNVMSQSSTTSENQSSSSKTVENDYLGLADQYWTPFKTACSSTLPVKIREIALDSLQKLIAHKLLRGALPTSQVPPSQPIVQSSSSLFLLSRRPSVENDLTSLDTSLPSPPAQPSTPVPEETKSNESNTPVELKEAGKTPSNWSISSTSTTPRYLIDDIIHTACTAFTGASTEDIIQVQVIKVLLSCITSTACEIHEISLLKVIQTCFNIHLYTKNPTNAITAKASLTQMINLVFSRMERYADVLKENLQNEELKNAIGKLNSEEKVDKLTQEPIVNETESSSAEAINEGSESENDAKVENIPEVRVEEVAEKPPLPSSSSAHKELTEQPVAENNPNDPTIAYYNELLRKDAFLVFRLLCRLSMHSDSTITQSSTFSGTAVGDVMDELSQLAIKARHLALELILSALNNSGPVFQTDGIYIILMKQQLSLSISRNAFTTNPTLFELGLSIFLMIIRIYRAHLKSEIELLLTTVYFHILEMNSSTYKQKSMVLQGLLKICENPQTLADIFLNYDCDLGMVSVFEKIVGVCEKITQGKELVIPSSSGMLGFGNDSKADLMKAQDRRLKLRGLCCLVAIVNSLVDWSKELAPDLPVVLAVNTTSTRLSTVSESSSVSNLKKLSESRNSESRNSRSSTSKSFQDALAPITPSNPVVVVKHPLHNVTMHNNTPYMHSNLSSSSVNSALNALGTTDDSSTQIEEIKSRKVLMQQRIKYFNEKPEKAVALLIKDGFLSEDPESIAAFLRNTAELDKAAIGDYIGSNDPLSLKTMHAFIDNIDFAGLDFVSALRIFLQTFRLPGEAQKIDRLMEKFADRFCENNPDVFQKADTAYLLAYSVIMLNTDAHSSQIKHRMDKAAFFKNNSGIIDDQVFLGKIFDEIQQNEIILEEEHAGQMDKMAIGWGAGDLNDRQRMEAYRKEIAVIQKKSQHLMQNAVANRAVAPFKIASNPDLARLMFSIASWPLMASFSLRFEAAPDDEEGETNGGNRKSGAVEPKTVDLCLQGLLGSIRLASMFRLETERDAFVTTLSKLTGLQNVHNIKPKHVKVIKSLIALTNTLGEHLEGGWVQVLRTISLMERLQIIANRSAFDSAAALVAYEKDSNRKSSESKRGNDTSNLSTLSFGVFGGSSEVNKSRISRSSSTRRVSVDQETGAKLGPLMEKLAEELQGQNIVIAIDKIFSHTVNLSGTAIIHFFKALCEVSLEEVGLEPISASAEAPPSLTVSGGIPRMYLLQKLVEISYYNMHRIRYEWSQIWKLIQPHFNTVACHSNVGVAIFAVDSLRQLSMKFLEREELSHYNTQSEFLKSFEWIMKYNTNIVIRELILSSITQMITARSKSIKSGWKSIFVVLSRVTDGLSGVEEDESRLVNTAFEIVQSVFRENFDLVVNAGAFVDYVNCLVEFALLKGVRQLHDEVVMGSIQLLQFCAKHLVKLADEGGELAVGSKVGSTVASNPPQDVEIPTNSTNISVTNLASLPKTPYMLANGLVSEEHFHLKWFPILSAFSRVIVDSESLLVRTRSLDALFDTLRMAGRLFDVGYWKAIHRSILFPIFEDLRDPITGFQTPSREIQQLKLYNGTSTSPMQSNKREDTTAIWIQALRHLVDLTTYFFDILATIPGTPLPNNELGPGVAAAVEAELLKGVLDLILSMLRRKDETLTTTGQICLHQFLQSNISRFQQTGVWTIVTDAIVKGFIFTLPAELLNCKFGTKNISAIEMGLSGAADEVTALLEYDSENLTRNGELTVQYGLYAAKSALEHIDGIRGVLATPISSPVMVSAKMSDAVTLDGLEFDHTVVKCGTHLELVQTILDIALIPLPASVNVLSEQQTAIDLPRPNSPSRPRSSSDPSGLTSPKPQLPSIQTLQTQATVSVQAINALPTAERKRWLSVLYDSYTVARAFNANYDLRYAIWKKGLVEHMPNLVKQETISLATYIRLLFAVYRSGGGKDSESENILKSLIRETMDVLHRYGEFISDQQKNQRDLALWSPVIVMVFKELTTTDELWDSKAVRESLSQFIIKFYKAAIRIILVDRIEVRLAIQEFLIKVGERFVV